jgi:hypothetical protein
MIVIRESWNIPKTVNITALGVRSTRYGLAVYYQTHLLPTAGSHGERVLQGDPTGNNKD